MQQKDPVLIVLDDDPNVSSLVCAIGQRAGFNAMRMTSADGLRQQLHELCPEVVALDLQMPGCDGISLLRYFAESNLRTGVVLVTGMDQRTIAAAEQFGRSLGLRMLGAFQKPFEPDDLLVHLERAHAAIRPLTAHDLEQAIANNELLVHYQPTIRRFADDTWDVAAVEALIRWNHPVRGLLTPDAFISMGQERGLTRAMTDFVIQRGVEQLKGWQAARLDIGLRINIAAALIADLEFPDRLERVLVEHSLEPELLTLEVTEIATLQQRPETFDILTRLRIKNINLAIDDFGIGYSSLTQLVGMPFNEMKIDRSIVSSTPESRDARIMVEALVSLAHKFDLAVCAEGVEKAETLAFLSSVACDAAQGFYVGPPATASEVAKTIASWDRNQPRRATGR